MRFLHNDTPESVFRPNKPQPGGKEARQAMAELLGVVITDMSTGDDEHDTRKKGFFKVLNPQGKVIGSSIEGTVTTGASAVDSYGRLIGTIEVSNKGERRGKQGTLLLNFEMAESGFAWPVFYLTPGFDWKEWRRYSEAFNQAIATEAGLFQRELMLQGSIHETPTQNRARLSGRPCQRMFGVLGFDEGSEEPIITVYPPHLCEDKRFMPRPETILGGKGNQIDEPSLKKLVNVRRRMPMIIQVGGETLLGAEMAQHPDRYRLSPELKKIILDVPRGTTVVSSAR